MINLGTVRPGSTIVVPFHTFDSNDPSASVAIAAFVLADIGIYKGTSMTERASTTGVVLLDTLGIDLDGAVGIGGFSIDLSSNATAGFYASGSRYYVTVGPVTVDAAVVNFVPVTFDIGFSDAIINTTVASATSDTQFILTDGPAEADVLIGCPVLIQAVASAIGVGIQIGYITDYIVTTKEVFLAADPGGGTVTAADHVAIFMPSNMAAAGGRLVTAAAAVTVNAELGASATAMNNLELMYDGTGYIDDTAPSSRSQITGINATGAAVNVLAIAAPNGFTLTTGSEVNDEDSTHELDDTRHELSDDTGTLEAFYEFDIGGDGLPTSVTFKGVFQSGDDSFDIYANSGTDGTPVWEQVGTIVGKNGTKTEIHTLDLFTNQIVTDIVGRVQIRINGTGLTTSSFDTDQVFVSKAIVTRTVGYANGMVWIDTVDGVAGVESYVNGVADNPVDLLASAITIATGLNMHLFYASRDSIIAPSGDFNDYTIRGTGYTFTLGGHDYAGTHIYHASPLTGIATSAGNADHFDVLDSIVGDVTVDDAHFTNCGFTGTLTLSGVGSGTPGKLRLVDCFSLVAGATTPILDFGTGSENHNAIIGNWQNGLEIQNFNVTTTGGTDLLSISGTGQLIINANCDGGTINLRGQWKVANNSGGAVTILQDDPATSIIAIEADTNELQTDWTDDGRLDLILDAIKVPTDKMVFTSAGRIDSNVDAINDNTVAAVNLAASALGIIPGLAETGTLSTTVMTSGVTGFLDDELIGRVIVWTGGTAAGQASDITDYSATNGTFTYTAITTAPLNGDAFVVI